MPRKTIIDHPKKIQKVECKATGELVESTHKNAVRRLLQDSAQEIVANVISAAQNGDMQAARIILDKIIPAKKDAPVTINLPPIKSSADAAEAMAAVLAGVSEGSLTLSEADGIAKLIGNYINILELTDLEARLKSVENALEKHASKIS